MITLTTQLGSDLTHQEMTFETQLSQDQPEPREVVYLGCYLRLFLQNLMELYRSEPLLLDEALKAGEQVFQDMVRSGEVQFLPMPSNEHLQ